MAATCLGHGGGEQQRAGRVGHLLQNGLQLLLEAHVQHLVGLVQHHALHLSSLHVAAAHQVVQPARGGDQDVHAAFQSVRIWVH
jgi:hypothetical protein